MRCCSALTMSWKSERNLPFLIILILLFTILFFLDLNCETITKNGSSTFSLTLSSSRSPSSSSSSPSSSWSSFWSPPDHLWCICETWVRVSYGSAVWDTKGRWLTGLSHTGGRRSSTNTLLDVESTAQHLFLLQHTGGKEGQSPILYWQ